MVLIGEPTNEDLDTVVAKWWGTMTAIASFDEKLDLLLRSVWVGTIVDLEIRDYRLRILLIDGMSRMVDDWRLLQGLPEVDKG